MARVEGIIHTIAKSPVTIRLARYLADSGHLLCVHNRLGNVNDGSASIPFLLDVFTQIKQRLGDAYTLRFRMDGDLFKQDVA